MITDRTREKLAELSELMARRRSAGRWLVLTHDNPDPDSIASAYALGLLLRLRFKRRVTIAYGGIIGRAENQEMVRTLGIRLSHIRHLTWKNYKYSALVDTQPGTGNNQLPTEIVPHLIFDHHPLRRTSHKAPFSDIRVGYGALATMMAEYLEAAELEISRKSATALVYAIRSETQDFGREYVQADKAVYDELHARSDLRALARIRSPQLPLTYYRNLHEALENLATVDTLIVSHLLNIDQPDIVPEIADLLLQMEGKTWSLCTGAFDGRLYLSIRTTNPRADAGRLMRRLLGKRGKGGGHGMMAGGWISLEHAPTGDPAKLQVQLAARLARYLKKNPDRIQPISLSEVPTGADVAE